MAYILRRFGAKLAASAILALIAFLPISADASVLYTYDGVGRIATALYDNGLCVVYAYDANGNRTSQTSTTGETPASPTWGTGVWGCYRWTHS